MTTLMPFTAKSRQWFQPLLRYLDEGEVITKVYHGPREDRAPEPDLWLADCDGSIGGAECPWRAAAHAVANRRSAP